MKILISGFESFLEVSRNISETVLTRLHIDSIVIHKVLLPVSYDRCFTELKKKIDEVNPDLIIMMGVARMREVISLELNGTNIINQEIMDNDNNIPQKNLDFETFQTSLDIKSIVSKCEGVEISSSAGGYVCNYLYYNCLKNISIPSLFIHLPAATDTKKDSNFSVEDLKEAVVNIISAIKLEV